MASIYERLGATAVRLMAQFNQGAVEYVQPGVTTGPAWNPTVGAPIVTRIDAVKAGGPKLQEYAQRGLIAETDLLLACTGLPVEPVLGHQVRIDGVEHQIVMVDRATLPGEVAVVWMVGVRR